MTMIGKDFPVWANAFLPSSEKRVRSAAMSPADTLRFDIFSPPPGDTDVMSQIERLSSKETNIAPRLVRIAVGSSCRSAIDCMAVSTVGDCNLTLRRARPLSTSP
jgi:hypothetical protein